MRAPKPLVAERESLLNQRSAAGCDRLRNGGQQGAANVIGHDNPVVPVTERPGRVNLEFDLPHLAASIGERQKRRDIAVDHAYSKAAVAQQARMAAAARYQVEHQAARLDKRQKPFYPRKVPLRTQKF